jgi:hypothetical protein
LLPPDAGVVSVHTQDFLADVMARFHPGVGQCRVSEWVQLDATTQILSLAKREADIAR